MVSLRCDDYGYDCDFVTEGDVEKVIDAYWEHMNNEHGIDYTKGRLLHFIKKENLNPPQIH